MSWWIVTLIVLGGLGVIGLGLYFGRRGAAKEAPDDVYPMW